MTGDNPNAADEEPEGPQYAEDVPSSFQPGGLKFLAVWNDWIKQQRIGPSTQKLYTRKLKYIIHHFEDKIKDFKMDKMFYPLELKMVLPPLTGFLDLVDSPGAKSTAAKTYKWVCLLLQKLFADR